MKNNFVTATKKSEVPTAYPDVVETGWKGQQSQPYTYRTNSQTDPISEAWGFVLKYSLWALLSVVIAVGLALRNDWDAGTLLVVWGLIATGGYILIFLLLSIFTPEGVAVTHEFFDYLRHRTDSNNNVIVELKRLEIRHDLLLAAQQQPQLPEQAATSSLEQAAKPSVELPALAWRPDADFVESIEDELLEEGKPVNQDNNAVSILCDFVIDLYDHADELLIDNQRINVQAGVTLPWSRRSEIPMQTKTAMQDMLNQIEPPLFQSTANGRVWLLNTAQYPTKHDAINALSV